MTVTDFDVLTIYRHTFPEHDRIMRTVFGEGLPSAEQLERNMSLLIHCTTGSMYYPHAHTPNIVHIGPTHIKKPKPLPEVSIMLVRT